jgi:hypothetical protein
MQTQRAGKLAWGPTAAARYRGDRAAGEFTVGHFRPLTVSKSALSHAGPRVVPYRVLIVGGRQSTCPVVGLGAITGGPLDRTAVCSASIIVGQDLYLQGAGVVVVAEFDTVLIL